MHDVTLLDAVAQATESNRTLPEMVRPLLDLLGEISGLETTFLTEVDHTASEQVLRQLHRADGTDASALEGFRIPWDDTLCKAALDRGVEWFPDVPAVLPDNPGWKVMGWRTYVSVPIRLPGEQVVQGTLCGASAESSVEQEDVLRVFELFARLVADHITRAEAEAAAIERAEAAERELAQRLEFVAMAEHALKNPLQLIGGWTDVLLEKSDRLTPELQHESLLRIRTAALRMREQVDAMLGESRAEAIAGEADRRDLDLGAFVTALADDWTSATALAFGVEVAPGATVHIDPRVLRIVLEHLLENAASFVEPHGRIELHVSREEDRVVLHVDDDGPGVPEGIDVFAPFSRGGSRVARSGVGLGLYVVRRLVEGESGRVATAESPLGGARFTVELPAA